MCILTFWCRYHLQITCQTRMLFSRKRTICVTHRSQNIENTWAFLSFKVDDLQNNDIDLHMTLTCK